MNTLFDKGREGFADGSIDWDTHDVRAMLVKSAYTFDISDEFLSDIPASSHDNGRTAALAGKSATNGILDANDTSVVALAADPCNAVVLFKHTGSDATARLIAYLDGRFRFTLSANTSNGGTTINFDALLHAIADNAVATKISGTGPSTIQFNGAVAAGAHSATVDAIGSQVNENAVYEVDISGNVFPFTPGVGQTVNKNWDNGANKILKI